MPSDPPVFDEFKLAFIFVPHGAPEPTEWLQRHPDYIKLPAYMVRRAGGGGPVGPSPPNPSFGQHRTTGGFAASPDPGASGSPTGNAMSDAASAGTNEGADRAWTSDDPVAAYRRANEALATAASRYVSDQAGASNPSADAGNRLPNRTVPSGSLAERVAGAIWHSIIPSAEAQPVEPEAENRGLLADLVDPLAELRIKEFTIAKDRLHAIDPGNREIQGLTATNCNRGKTPGADAFFVCVGSEQSDSSCV